MTPRRLELDYVAAAHRSPWPGAAVLGIALLLAVLLGARHVSVARELDALGAQQGVVSMEQRPQRAAVPKERLDEEMKQVEAAVRQLTLPWAQIIEAVESAATPGVRIVQMQPDAQQRLLRLTAEATTQEAMLEYVRRLSQAKALAEAHLVTHQVQTEDPSHPLQFSVQAAFLGDKG